MLELYHQRLLLRQGLPLYKQVISTRGRASSEIGSSAAGGLDIARGLPLRRGINASGPPLS